MQLGGSINLPAPAPVPLKNLQVSTAASRSAALRAHRDDSLSVSAAGRRCPASSDGSPDGCALHRAHFGRASVVMPDMLPQVPRRSLHQELQQDAAQGDLPEDVRVQRGAH